MIGTQPTLQDIVLTEQPELIDLACHEQMLAEEEEESESRDIYRVSTDCGVCRARLKFLCLAYPDDIHRLNRLLFDLRFICVSCVTAEKLNHGG